MICSGIRLKQAPHEQDRSWSSSTSKRGSLAGLSFYLVLLVLTLCSGQAARCQSADPLALGMQQYNANNFAAAKTQLEIAVRQHPTSAQLEYVLGNTYFHLGDKAQAIKAYEACVSLNPSPTVSGYCQKMLTHLKPAASVASNGPSAAAGGDSSGEPDAAQSKIQAKKREIMKRAEEECNKVRKETQAQIAEAEANGNRWVRSIEKNDVHPTISKEERAEIESESEKKTSRIMEEATRRANMITSP